jgi:hypothetical protein
LDNIGRFTPCTAVLRGLPANGELPPGSGHSQGNT